MTAALALYGQGDDVGFSPESANTNTVSLEAWFRVAQGIGGYIIGNGDANDLRITSGILECRITDGTITTDLNSPTAVDDNEWHHVVGVRNGTSAVLYIDGASVDTESGLGSGAYPYSVINIGQRGDDTGYFRGALNGVAMYGSALTAGEVTARYNGGTFTAVTDQFSLVAGYNCTEGTGTTLNDVSANNRDGTIVGTAGTRWVADRDRSTPQTWYASPSGSLANTGVTSGSPWDIVTIFSNPASVIAGDTIQLASGTYSITSRLNAHLTGASGSRITVKSPDAPGTFPSTVLIDCAGITALGGQRGVQIEGAYTDYWDIEVFNSDPDKVSTQPGSNPDDIAVVIGIWLVGNNINLYYPHVHDNSGVGIACYDPAGNILVHGALGYNNGWRDDEGGVYGMTVYTHNGNVDSTLTYREGISFNDYNYAFQQYSSEYEFDTYNIHIEGWHFANRSMVLAGASPKHGFTLSDIDGYFGGIGIGYNDEDNYEMVADNLYVYSDDAPVVVRSWREFDLSDSVIVTTEAALSAGMMSIGEIGTSLGTNSYTNNAYYPGPSPTLGQMFVVYNQNGTVDTYRTFANWQSQLGYDVSGSTFNTGSGGLPTANVVRYFADAVTDGRGIFVIWNWTDASTISVNLSNFTLSNNQAYSIYNAMKPDTVFASGTYSTESPSINLTTVSNGIASRINDAGTTPSATLPDYGIFLLIPGEQAELTTSVAINGNTSFNNIHFT